MTDVVVLCLVCVVAVIVAAIRSVDLQHARQERMPPMPWFNVRAMSDADLRAIYRYVKAAGPAGQPVPAYVPPGQAVSGPAVRFP